MRYSDLRSEFARSPNALPNAAGLSVSTYVGTNG